MELVHQGKVRDVYAVGRDELILVASDRVSVYDVVLPTPVPDKGALLTAISLWWFGVLADVVPNHVVSTDVPPEFAGRAVRVRRLDMVPVECVARGYLSGSGLVDYQRTGAVCGVALPPGLVEADRLPEPIFTPTTKAPSGTHDAPMTFDDVVSTVGGALAERLRSLTLEIYTRGAERAAANGILLADTKLEFGLTPAGVLTLADEVLTPDSSRFWPAGSWQPGRPQRSFDKQPVRDWAAGTGWNKQPPGPELPPEIVAATRERYIAAYEHLTAQRWRSPLG